MFWRVFMGRIVLICVAFNLLPLAAYAQRDPPIWESHLASLSIYHESRSSLTIEILYKKEGGPYEHNQHRMYLLAYLKKDEGKILALASFPTLPDRTEQGGENSGDGPGG